MKNSKRITQGGRAVDWDSVVDVPKDVDEQSWDTIPERIANFFGRTIIKSTPQQKRDWDAVKKERGWE